MGITSIMSAPQKDMGRTFTVPKTGECLILGHSGWSTKDAWDPWKCPSNGIKSLGKARNAAALATLLMNSDDTAKRRGGLQCQ